MVNKKMKIKELTLTINFLIFKIKLKLEWEH